MLLQQACTAWILKQACRPVTRALDIGDDLLWQQQFLSLHFFIIFLL